MADAVVLKPQALAALSEGVEAGILLHVSGGSTGDAYRQHARLLAAALREPDNAQLRQRLLSGSMAPGQLALVPQTELASGAVRAQHRRIEEDMHRPAREFGAGLWMPAALPCPSCSGRDTEYMPAMEQRDIRKAEVWGGADTESRYRVHCRQCDSTWFTDSVY
jgi:hypothetical protein